MNTYNRPPCGWQRQGVDECFHSAHGSGLALSAAAPLVSLNPEKGRSRTLTSDQGRETQ